MKHWLFILTALLLLSFTGKKELINVKSFGWLEGSWGMKTKRGTITEAWKITHDSLMVGNSKMINLNGEERILENLELVFSGGQYYYVSAVNGQNGGEQVKFTITSYNEKSFVAENPQHDFPKRITYNLINNDSIHAFIDGGPAMPDKKSNFHYSRIKD